MARTMCAIGTGAANAFGRQDGTDMSNDEKSPLLDGWSTKDLLYVVGFLGAIVVWGLNIGAQAQQLAMAVTQLRDSTAQLTKSVSELNSWAASLEARQEVQGQRLDATESRSIECLKGGRK